VTRVSVSLGACDLPRLFQPVITEDFSAGTHVVRLYQRIKRVKNHQEAVVAVARHLAEAAWWVLTKQELYRKPHGAAASSFVNARVSADCHASQ